MPAPYPAIFLDRDGTLIADAGYLADPAGVEILPGVQEGLRDLKAAGFVLIIVTNQSGIGRGYYTEADYHAVAGRTDQLLGAGLIDAAYFSPWHPEAAAPCRKPAPGMLLQAAREHSLDLPRSFMIGDRKGDIEAGRAAGCAASLLVCTGLGKAEAPLAGADFVAPDFAAAAAWILRRAHKCG